MSTISTKWEIPPIEKVHEAFSAVVDNRVKLNENFAKVSSSDYSKEYTIEWNENEYSSNDNASYYKGYIGYPVIAILMLQNKIDYNVEIAKHFKGINWKALNTKHKNNYSVAVAEILNELQSKGVDIGSINIEVNRIYEQVKNIDIIYKKSKHFPPK